MLRHGSVELEGGLVDHRAHALVLRVVGCALALADGGAGGVEPDEHPRVPLLRGERYNAVLVNRLRCNQPLIFEAVNKLIA